MGGCTITKVNDSVDAVLHELKEQIYGAITSGLWPDSEVIVLKPSTQEAKIYLIKYTYSKDGRDPLPHSIEFEETENGRAFHVGIAAIYGPKPEAHQYVGTVHVHT